jgi:hypothetical protein
MKSAAKLDPAVPLGTMILFLQNRIQPMLEIKTIINRPIAERLESDYHDTCRGLSLSR